MRRLIFFFLLVALFVSIAWWVRLPREINRPESAARGSNAELAADALQALTMTENLEAMEAAVFWQRVLEARPQDVGVIHNVAVNRLLQYTQTVGSVLDPAMEPGKAAEVRQTLPDLYRSVETAIAALQSQDPKSDAAAWMAAELRQQQARLLPSVVAESVRREIAENLLATMQSRPKELFMGILIELSESANLSDLAPQIAETYIKVSDANPRNLVLAADAAVRAVEQKLTGSTTMVARLLDLSVPLAEEIRQLGQPVEDLAVQVRQAIASEEWESAANLLAGWSNVLRISAAYRTDFRKLHPHVLDFLLVAPVYQLTAMAEAEAAPQVVPSLDFRSTVLSTGDESREPFRQVLPVDVDLDDQSELVTLSGTQLDVWKINGNRLELFAKATASADADLIVWADLFVVDSGSAERQKASRAGLSAEEQQKFANVHDTFPCLLVGGPSGVEVFRTAAKGETPADRLLPPSKETGLEAVANVTAMSRGDVDSDGDLDLILATKTGIEIWINRGNMTFYPIASHSQLPSVNSPVVSLAMGDVDRDLDIDFVTLQADGTVGLLENILHQQFRWSPLNQIELEQGSEVLIGDFNGDVSWDLVVCGSDQMQVATSVTPDTGLWKIAGTEALGIGGQGSRLADFNHDTWMDVAVWDTSGMRIYLGRSPGDFVPQAIELSTTPIAKAEVFDLFNDRKLDVVAIDGEGQLSLRENMTENLGHSLAVRYLGIDDNATGRVNHYAIGSLVEVWFDTHYRAAIIQDRTTHFGLGSCAEPTTMRVVLTNGATQHVPKPKVDTVLNEKQELKGSCPYLYAWNGQEFVFVTDCLWAAPLGLQATRGKVIPDRPWEYLLVPGKHVAEQAGHYELRVTEELWEIGYFDQIELTAVDHPAGTEVYTNEKVGPPQIAEHKLYSFANLQPPRQCLDNHGNNVNELIAHEDRRYVQAFDYRIVQGLVQPHSIEIDLGEVKTSDRVILVLNGWLLPTDTSLNIALDQNPDLPSVRPPSVWVPEGTGWREAIPFMGFPGGKTKTIVVDLSEVVQADDPRVQIRTSAQLYWDRVAVAINPAEVPVKTQPVDLVSAELAWHGFSDLLPRSADESHRYCYEKKMEESKWPPLLGRFTRYGDVLPLLREWDDAMVIMGPGDEIRLKFRLPERAPPEGWVRDFVMHNVGWDKDADLNTLTGQTVGPLPTRSMRGYPFAESVADHEQGTKRHLLERQQRFRSFWRRQPAREKDHHFVDIESAGL